MDAGLLSIPAAATVAEGAAAASPAIASMAAAPAAGAALAAPLATVGSSALPSLTSVLSPALLATQLGSQAKNLLTPPGTPAALPMSQPQMPQIQRSSGLNYVPTSLRLSQALSQRY